MTPLWRALFALFFLPTTLAAAHPVPEGTPALGEGLTIPLAVGDVDGDGDLDVAMGNVTQPNQLFRNEGGTFVGEETFGIGSTFAVAFADVDDDGDLDLAVGNGQGQPNALYRNDGTGVFTHEPAFGDSNHTIAIAWGDVDADGDLDLAVGNGLLGHHEQNELYRNRGDGTFVREPAFGEGQTAALVLTDVDGDGDLDAVVGNGGFGAVAANALYLNRGDGTFDGRPEFGKGDTACLVAGDLDGDGDVDVAVANWGDVDRQNRLYRNDGTGYFTGEDAFGNRDTNTLALGDVDHDGDLDLAAGNGDFRSADQNHLYLNDGAGHFEELAALGEGSTDAIVWADLDADGDLDALVGNEHSPTQNLIFDNVTDDDDWLVISLTGGRRPDRAAGANRSAIGARVLVYEAEHLGDADHLLAMREVMGHGGFASQSHLAVHVGLPGRDTVDVEVRWPASARGSHVQDRRGVAVGTRLAIEEIW